MIKIRNVELCHQQGRICGNQKLSEIRGNGQLNMWWVHKKTVSCSGIQYQTNIGIALGHPKETVDTSWSRGHPSIPSFSIRCTRSRYSSIGEDARGQEACLSSLDLSLSRRKQETIRKSRQQLYPVQTGEHGHMMKSVGQSHLVGDKPHHPGGTIVG